MSDTVLVSLITSVLGPIMIAIVGALLSKRVSKIETATTKINNQVSNAHGTNLRDDLDHISGTLAEVQRVQAEHSQQLGELRQDDRTQRDQDRDLERRVRELEHRRER